jgi:hypothetical protein
MAESKSQDRTCERHGFSDSTGLDGQERGTVIKRPVPIALGIGPSFFFNIPPSLSQRLSESKQSKSGEKKQFGEFLLSN